MKTRQIKSVSQASSGTTAKSTAKSTAKPTAKSSRTVTQTVTQKRKGKSAATAENFSTAGSSNGFTTEQLALYNTMRAQLAAEKKAAAAAQDEGKSILV